MPTPYEKARNENIKRNREALLALGLDELKAYVPPKATKKAPAAKSRKRKSPPLQDADEDESKAKALKTRAAQEITNTSGVRRSARNAGKEVDYKSEIVRTLPEVISTAAKNAKNSESKSALERRHNPYVDPPASCHTIVNAYCRVGNVMATSPTSRLVIGGQQGTLRLNPHRPRIRHVLYREACSADAVHA
jgi:hypothetical protein